jgi:putative membrane protein
MHNDYEWMWGMHWGWWIFWIVVIIALVIVFKRGLPNQSSKPPRETPLETLQRRYAAGEITIEEYEERKAHLEQDSF